VPTVQPLGVVVDIVAGDLMQFPFPPVQPV
jgi:hypothetical protein